MDELEVPTAEVSAAANREARSLAEYDAALTKGVPPLRVVPVLMGLNLAVFLIMAVSGVGLLDPAARDLFNWGGNFPPVTMDGQWWRLFTSMFLHAGVIHIAFNLFVLWTGGLQMEPLLGRLGFALTYLLSGLVGSIATLVWHPYAVGVGASGAIFGLYGALLGFLVRDRKAIPRPALVASVKGTLLFLGYNLVYSLKPGVDLSAHAGGLLAGFFCGLALCRRYEGPLGFRAVKTHQRTLVAGLVMVVALAAGAEHLAEGKPLGPEAAEALAADMKGMLQRYFDAEKEGRGTRVHQVSITERQGRTFTGTVVLGRADQVERLPLSFTMEPGAVRWTLAAPENPRR